MASHMKFKCPKCGGFKFGSSNCTKPFSEWMGHCHGYKDGRPCGLSWHRETQDSEVMHEEVKIMLLAMDDMERQARETLASRERHNT